MRYRRSQVRVLLGALFFLPLSKEVISFVGDGSYLLNNSDIYSSVITNNKLIIIVCDNGGHAVINRLQLFKGGKEFNCLFESSKNTNITQINFAEHAASMGAKSEEVSSISELEDSHEFSIIPVSSLIELSFRVSTSTISSSCSLLVPNSSFRLESLLN